MTQRYGTPIRVLHAALALGISLQLLLSLVMEQPRPGRTFTAVQSLTFSVHEWVGLALLAVLVAHGCMVVLGQAAKGPGHFYPWFSGQRLRGLGAEARQLARLQIGDPETQDALAGAVQGIGLLMALVVAVTGTVIFFGMAADGAMTPAIRSVRKVHTTVGPLLWGYLAIHAGAAMLHLALGHRSILAIFRARDA
jgi:cytochrome b561